MRGEGEEQQPLNIYLEEARRRGRPVAIAVKSGQVLLRPVVAFSPPRSQESRELRAWHLLLCVLALATDDYVFFFALPALVR